MLSRGRERSDLYLVDEKFAGVVGTGILIVTANCHRSPNSLVHVREEADPNLSSRSTSDRHRVLIPPRCCPSISEAEVERLSHR
jgi:hypothetical protein